MARHEAALAAVREELTRQEAALRMRRVELSAREAGLNSREADLNRRQAALDARQDDTANQDVLLGSRREEMARREAAMVTFQKALVLREAKMSAKLRRAAELEERANAMGDNTHPDRQIMALERQRESERANLQGLMTEKSEHAGSSARPGSTNMAEIANYRIQPSSAKRPQQVSEILGPPSKRPRRHDPSGGKGCQEDAEDDEEQRNPGFVEDDDPPQSSFRDEASVVNLEPGHAGLSYQSSRAVTPTTPTTPFVSDVERYSTVVGNTAAPVRDQAPESERPRRARRPSPLGEVGEVERSMRDLKKPLTIPRTFWSPSVMEDDEDDDVQVL